MEEKTKLLAALEDISSVFRDLSDEWTTTCFEDNFSDFGSFVHAVRFSVLHGIDYLLRLSELCSRLLLYAGKVGKSTEIWNELAERGFDAKKLCVFSWYLIERGQQPDVVFDDRKIGVIGARIYSSLCCLNGSQAFSIFNDYLFQRALEVMQSVCRLFSCEGNFESVGRKGAGGRMKSKHNKKPRDVSNSEIQLQSHEQLSLDDKTELKEMLFDALDSLFTLLSKVSLSSSEQSATLLAILLQRLMQIDFSEKTSLLDCKRLSDFQRLQNFSDRSFALLHRLLDSRHASWRVVYGRILMPRLMFWTQENIALPANAHPPKIMSVYKDAMINLVRMRVKDASEEEVDAILLVLQNACFRCPDRSDYRVKIASSVLEALAELPSKKIQEFANFLWLIGTNTKIATRGFVIEIAPTIVKQYGNIVENYEEREATAPLVAVKEEIRDEEQLEDDNVPPNTGEGPMEVDEANMEEDGENIEQTRKRSKKKKTKRDSLLKKVGLSNAILILLLRSCSDKSPIIRARALTQIALLLNDVSLRNRLLEISENCKNYLQLCADDDGNSNAGENIPSPKLLSIIVARCADARVSTRKAAVLALEALFVSLTELEQIEVLQAFKHRCRDPSLLVRKQAAESLSHLLLLAGVNSDALDNVWLSSVLPLVNDREQSVVHLASKLVLDTLILPILEDEVSFAWRVLSAVEQEVNHRRLLLRSLLHQAKEGELKEHVVAILLKKCNDSENANIVWMLLNFLSTVFKIDVSPVVRFWSTLDRTYRCNLTGYVAEIIARCSDRIRDTDRNSLIENIGNSLMEFRISECHITQVYYAFARLCKGIGDDAPGAKQLFEFNQNLVDKSFKTLRDIIFRPVDATDEVLRLSQESVKTAELLVRTISSLGEAIQYSPTLLNMNPKIFDIMQLVMASDVIQQQLTQTGTWMNTMPTGQTVRPSAAHCTGSTGFVEHEPQQAGTSNGTGGKEADDYGHAACSSRAPKRVGTEGSQETASQGLRASQPTSHGLGPTFLGQHTFNVEVLSPAVRAQAVLAIGKMCLQDERLAKKCVPVFSRQLLVNSSHLVRSNIVSVVCDLCKRYTLLVDRHSAIVASCLKNPSTLVRKQTLMLLTHLIKEQFVRWEGQIMYRFVSTILDENEEVCQYAEMCLIDVLLVQFPNMFVNHFLECVFYFNSVTHGSWLAANNAMEEDAEERQELKCSLSGSRLKNARMTLYKFMIKTFNDENKFTIGMRIGQEVYSAIVDGVLDIRDRRVKALLEDCYEIMCCPEIKLSMALGKRSPNEADDDDDEPPSNVQEAAKKVVTQAFRKGIIDAILPHVIQLKYYLQEKRFPELEFGIIRVLRELCKDHRDQLDEFLASDKQLKAEIKFDLEKLEEKERRAKTANNNNSAVRPLGSKGEKRVSFVPNNKTPVLARRSSGILKHKSGAGKSASNESQKSGHGEEVQDLVNDIADVGQPNLFTSAPDVAATKANENKLTKIAEEEMDVDDINNKDEGTQPSTSTAEETSSTSTAIVIKRCNKICLEHIDDEGELPPRAFSTPEHHLVELTFGLGDDISAIEKTPTRKRSRRNFLKPIAAIEEVDNESD